MDRAVSGFLLILIMLLGTGRLFSPAEAPQPYAATVSGSADLVLINGRIITVDSNDTIAEGVAVKNGTILKVGSVDEVRALIGPNTEVMDLDGKTVTPGLINAHNHIAAGVRLLPEYFLDVRPGKARSISDIVKMVGEKAEEVPKGEWILGNGWLPAWLAERRWPLRQDLDPVSLDHPVYLVDMSGWYGWANSYALRLSNITSETPNPPGGIIEKDPTTGQPTGILINHAAMYLLKTPPITMEQREEGIKYAAQIFLAHGVTSVYDNWIAEQSVLEAYRRLDSRGELPIRMGLYWLAAVNSEAQARRSLALIKPFEGDMVKFMGWKLQTDGTAMSAFTYEPHIGKANMPAIAPDELKKIVSLLHQSGLQISIHVAGDEALDITLDAYEAALADSPRLDHRHRVEHIQIPPKPGSLDRLKSLGLVICVQPTFIFNGGDFAYGVFGRERSEGMCATKTPLDMGIPIAISSDFPCTIDTSPQRTLWSAVTKRTFGGLVIGPGERVTIREALRMHTMGAAYIGHEEDIKGSIEEGKLGDMVVWSADPYEIPTDELLNMRAEITILGGRIVYRAPQTSELSPLRSMPQAPPTPTPTLTQTPTPTPSPVQPTPQATRPREFMGLGIVVVMVVAVSLAAVSVVILRRSKKK